MLILISLLITLASVIVAIEAANCVAYGRFADSREMGILSYYVGDNAAIDEHDPEAIILSQGRGEIGIVPLSFLSDYHLIDCENHSIRILRFTKLHREIEAKFKQLQQA